MTDGERRARVLAYSNIVEHALRSIRVELVRAAGVGHIEGEVDAMLESLNVVRDAAEQLTGEPVYLRVTAWANQRGGEASWTELLNGDWEARVTLPDGCSWSAVNPDKTVAVARLLAMLEEVEDH